LLRTAGCDINITDLSTEDLANYRLEGTEETIPTFRQVLDLFAGKAPLIIELKCDNNAEALVDTAAKAMEGYEGAFCMESFDPRCVYYLKKKHPHIIRGQLTEDYFRTGNKLPAPLKWVLKNQAANFLTMPDFVAYKYQDLHVFSNRLVRKFWGVAGVTWTLRSQEELDDAVAKGWIPIFENFKP
jgi:glycerophosphoryl diester phosphodiesterase